MPVINYKLPFKNGNGIIVQLGDSHDGTKARVAKKINEAKYYIKHHKARWIHTGDAAETILVDDPRYEFELHPEPKMDMQVESVAETWRDVSDTLIALLLGNHELRVRKYGNMTFAICKALGRIDAYGSWTSIINFTDGARTTTIGFWTHAPLRSKGRLSSTAGDAGQQKANTEASLKKLLAPLHNAHYMGCGHYHKLILRNPIEQLYLTTKGKHLHQEYTVMPDSGYIHPDLRWYGCNGAFMRQYMMSEEFDNLTLKTLEPITYSEIAGYAPVEMGLIAIHFRKYKIDHCEEIWL